MGNAKRICLVTTAMAGLGCGLTAPSAWAQTASASSNAGPQTKLDEVVVTGSSIRGIRPVGSTVVGVSQDDIVKQGQASLVDVLRDLPQVTNLGADDSRNAPGAAQRAVANTTAASGINLRGIGVEATLTLLDGQRLPPQGSEGRLFDPNSLPKLAVQRIEVVPDGASGVYGSDAVAGVVNIIPVTRFDGFQTDVRYGAAKGLNQEELNAITGKSWTGGHFVAAYEYSRRSDLLASSRPNQYVNSPIYGATSTSTSPVDLANNPGPPPFAFLPPATHQVTNPTGVLTSAGLAAASANPAGVQGNWVGVDALPEQIHNNAYLYADQQINEHVKIYAEGFYGERDFSRRQVAPSTTNLTIPGLAAGAFENAYSLVAPSVAANYSFINDVGNAVTHGYERSGQARLGGRFDIAGDWQGLVTGSMGRTASYTYSSNQLNSQALSAAGSCINPAQPNGPFAPPVTNVSTCHTTATAFDPFSNLQPGTAGFGYPDQATYQGVMRSIFGFSSVRGDLNQANLNFKADGTVFDLPGGRAHVAVGADLQGFSRKNVGTSDTSGVSTSEVDTTRDGTLTRKIDSLFAELFAPLIGENNHVPFVRSLSVSIAARYDHYNDQKGAVTDTLSPLPGFNHSYDTTNPKLGVNWVPVQDLTVHASYGTSFRAPVLADYAYGAPTLGIPFTVTSAVASALGVSATCATPSTCYLIEVQGGQPNLKPETAKTWSIGANYKPSQVPGLEMSLSYYDINYQNQIEVASSGPWQSNVAYALAMQKAGLLTPNPTLGSLGAYANTVRGYLSWGNANAVNPSARLTPYAGLPGFLFANGINSVSLLLNGLSQNSGTLETNGLDYTLRYSWSNSLGHFTVGDVGTIVLAYNQALVEGAPTASYLNQINNPMRFQSRGNLGWDNGEWTANAFINYVNAYQNPGIGTIPAFTTVDMSLSYSPSKSIAPWLNKTRISIDVQNLFDRAPPSTINIPNQMAYDPQEASAIGRMVSVTLSQKF